MPSVTIIGRIKIFIHGIIYLLIRPKRIGRSIRIKLLNTRKGIYVNSSCFLSKTVKFQLDPQGVNIGGKIHLDANCCVADGVILAPYGGDIYLAENVFIGPYSVLYGHGGLVIGKNTLIAAHCILIPSNHGFQDCRTFIREQDATSLGIVIGEDVWIGCGVKILDGVSIGKGCVIGAGAVVTKSLPEYSISVGVPAKVVGKRK
jgi:serine acetyltransferase